MSSYLKHVLAAAILMTSVACSASPVLAASKAKKSIAGAHKSTAKKKKIRKSRKGKRTGKARRHGRKHAASKKAHKGKLSAKHGKHGAKKTKRA